MPPGLPAITLPPFGGTTMGNTTYSFADMTSELGVGIVVAPVVGVLINIAIAKAYGERRSAASCGRQPPTHKKKNNTNYALVFKRCCPGSPLEHGASPGQNFSKRLLQHYNDGVSVSPAQRPAALAATAPWTRRRRC